MKLRTIRRVVVGACVTSLLASGGIVGTSPPAHAASTSLAIQHLLATYPQLMSATTSELRVDEISGNLSESTPQREGFF